MRWSQGLQRGKDKDGVNVCMCDCICLYSVALCVRRGSAIYYHSVWSLEDDMFWAEVVLIGQSHYGNELFVTAGFKSQFCTGDVRDLSTQMLDKKRLYVSHGKTDGANRSLEPTAVTWRWWWVKNKVEWAVWMLFFVLLKPIHWSSVKNWWRWNTRWRCVEKLGVV